MNKKLNASLVGIFTIIGIFFFCVFLLFLGKGSISPKLEYTLYFHKSVKGLSVGAPVMFRGVAIGTVSNICLAKCCKNDPTCERAEETISWPIQVKINIDPAAFKSDCDSSFWNDVQQWVLKKKNAAFLSENNLLHDLMINHGLRAKSQFLSLMTGKLYIELDFFEETTATPAELADIEKNIIPIYHSAFEKMFSPMSSSNMNDYVENFHLVMDQLSAFVKDGRFKKLLNNSSEVFADARGVLENGQKAIQTLSEKASDMMTKSNELMEQIKDEISSLNKVCKDGVVDIRTQTTQMEQNVSATADASRKLVEQLNGYLSKNDHNIDLFLEKGAQSVVLMEKNLQESKTLILQLQDYVDKDAPMQQDLKETLNELETAAISLKTFFEMLQCNPEVLLKGKGK